MTRRLLLCTDLDRTVLPNGPQPESEGARSCFEALADRPEVTLVYVTGRDRQLVSKAMMNYCLPKPDYVIGDVGTTIYETGSGEWHAWSEWQRAIAPDWAGIEHADLRERLLDIVDLQPQEPAKQNQHKLSFYVPLYSDTGNLSERINERAGACGVKLNLVWSIDEPRGIGLLDVLPASASKKHAIFFLMQRNGFALADTVFAGDSGNDLPVLVSEIHAVLVANASEEVRREALAQVTANGHAEALYIARGGLMGMNGNYAAGVLEGVVHYRPETRHWLPENVSDA